MMVKLVARGILFAFFALSMAGGAWDSDFALPSIYPPNQYLPGRTGKESEIGVGSPVAHGWAEESLTG